jgi:hypothetical protein
MQYNFLTLTEANESTRGDFPSKKIFQEKNFLTTTVFRKEGFKIFLNVYFTKIHTVTMHIKYQWTALQCRKSRRNSNPRFSVLLADTFDGHYTTQSGPWRDETARVQIPPGHKFFNENLAMLMCVIYFIFIVSVFICEIKASTLKYFLKILILIYGNPKYCNILVRLIII